MSSFGTGLSRFLYGTMIVGLILVAIGICAAIVFGVYAVVDPAALAETSARLNGQPVSLDGPAQSLMIAAWMVAVFLFVGVLLWQLLGMLRSVATGAPFTMANVRRLRIVAALFVAVVIVQLGALLLPADAHVALALQPGEVNLDTLFSALFALVLAEVFRAGVALREDVEGTV